MKYYLVSPRGGLGDGPEIAVLAEDEWAAYRAWWEKFDAHPSLDAYPATFEEICRHRLENANRLENAK